MRGPATVAALAFSLVPGAIRADVADSSSNGFTLKTAISIQAAPAEVYRKLIQNIGDWWDSAHTYSHDAHNLTIEEKPMGCFCEKLPGHGAVRHMEILKLAPGTALVMSGGLGPLQSLAVTGTLSIELAPEGLGTKLVMTYAVGGYLKDGLNAWAAPVDSVLKEQFTRLKNYAEHGSSTLKPVQ